ncbi:MAG: hypothetical protein PVJ09_05105 [Candidatus Woesebacteria bacterium]|jgi:hypothetical protein
MNQQNKSELVRAATNDPTWDLSNKKNIPFRLEQAKAASELNDNQEDLLNKYLPYFMLNAKYNHLLYMTKTEQAAWVKDKISDGDFLNELMAILTVQSLIREMLGIFETAKGEIKIDQSEKVTWLRNPKDPDKPNELEAVVLDISNFLTEEQIAAFKNSG